LPLVSSAAEAPWRSVAERRDFPVTDPVSVLEQACEELKGVYGAGLDISELVKSKHYIHSIRSEKHKVDVLFVMIEDHSVEEPDCYYEIVFELPEMTQVAVGGMWLDIPVEEYLNTYVDALYEDADYD